MKTFFVDAMAVPSRGYSPSAEKPRAVVADWKRCGLDIEIVEFDPITEADLGLAHAPRFARNILTGKSSNGHGNVIPEVTQSCLLTCGSLVAAARAAFTERIVASPTSGFHHAGYNYCGGFCTFNGLIVAARTVINEQLTPSVAILDWDAHYGDGTQDIIEQLELQDQIHHWTFGADKVSRGKRYNHGATKMSAEKMLLEAQKAGAKLVIYQAGADPHIDDPLGGYMTTEQMRDRDQFVFELCENLGLNVVFNLAGGYQQDKDGNIDAVLKLHRATAKEACRLLEKSAV